MYYLPQDERMNVQHPEGNEINQYGREMIDQGPEDLKSLSYQQTLEPQAMLNTHIQLAMNEPDRYLPIAAARSLCTITSAYRRIGEVKCV